MTPPPSPYWLAYFLVSAAVAAIGAIYLASR